MLLLGLILLIVGLVVPGLHALFIVGLILLIVGAALLLLGTAGHPVGGRSWWW